jgi:polyribonucleotide nucleotidyltransferase
MAIETTEIEVSPGKVVALETGKLARQAGGSVVVSMGETKVLVTACGGRESDGDFFPLTVEYREKAYAAGKIPGGYVKREARPSDSEVLTARMIDRPLRPLFPGDFKYEVQIVATVIGADGEHDSEAISIGAASLAVGLSDLPLEEQVAAVKVARVNGEWVVNPTHSELEEADVEMMIAGSESSIVMVEGGAYEISEQEMVDGIMAGHVVIKKLVAAQNALIAKIGPTKMDYKEKEDDAELFQKVETACIDQLKADLNTPMKKEEHYSAMAAIKKSVHDALDEAYPERSGEIDSYFGKIEKREMRENILNAQKRIDGRGLDQVRELMLETQSLSTAHGSAVFQRGETQALVVCTLGSKTDEQRVDTLYGDYFKNYYLHYNFPPFSVGETGRMSGPGRREIGHGHLAERSLEPVLPVSESFPYTIRLVSEILESNGSSSMASVCGGSMALMDAGVPIKEAVAGIAMGLISDGSRVEILSDITGTEDHLGDMDFKVTGTKTGITAFQMDIKIAGITPELMLKALEQAKAGRLHILEKMNASISGPREVSKNAPCILSKKIDESKIKDLIGPGGKVIRGIQEKSGANLDIADNGEVTISAPKRGNANMALKLIEEIFAEVEVGVTYTGKVKNITDFGLFAEVLPGKEGLVHISELDVERGTDLKTVFSVGETMPLKCINVDPQGRVKLSAKAAAADSEED